VEEAELNLDTRLVGEKLESFLLRTDSVFSVVRVTSMHCKWCELGVYGVSDKH